MATETSFDYYYGDESSQFSFYRIPRQLITGDRFKRLSTDAKLLYGLLLDRMGLSAKVVTGTYNFPGTYKIIYKTNTSDDYRTLADSLSTSQNHTLAASPTALGLASNERVTEIMFVFGQVPAGFSQVEAPMIYCTALPGLAAGSSFVNVADVGGVYNGVWVQAVSRWETTVYGKPVKLPRTGY